MQHEIVKQEAPFSVALSPVAQCRYGHLNCMDRAELLFHGKAIRVFLKTVVPFGVGFKESQQDTDHLEGSLILRKRQTFQTTLRC